MKERIRPIARYSSRTGWVLLSVLLFSTVTNGTCPVYAHQAPDIGLLQSSEAVIYNKVNAVRTKHGLPELTWAPDVAEVARRHSEDMAINGFFSHVNSDGAPVEIRLKNAGIVFSVSAENLFTSNDFTEIAKESVLSWMNSPPHLENLLNADVTETGIGIYKAVRGNNFYITQIFIKRALGIHPSPTRLAPREIDTIFDIIRTSIQKSKYDFNYSAVRKTILKELTRIGIPVEEDVYIEGLLRDTPVLSLTIDILAGNGFIVKFADDDPDVDLKVCGSLVHAQGYSAAVVINETDGKVRFPIIKMETSASK